MQNQNKFQRFSHMSKSSALFIILGSLIVIVSCSGKSGDYTPPKPLPTDQPGSPVETGSTKEALPELPLPENGYGKFFFKKSKTSSRLKFVPPIGTQDNMIVKLEDWDTGKAVCWFFVREGKAVETPIPEGSYRFKIATGKKWYGEQHLFGREATYSSISNNVKIPARTIYTLNLTPSVSGTLRDETIDAADF